MLSKIGFAWRNFGKIWDIVLAILDLAKTYEREVGVDSATAEKAAIETVKSDVYTSREAKEVAERDAWMHVREQPGSGG